MKYRKLGNTNIDVSVICLGTMTYGEQNTEAQAHEQLDFAVSQGVNFIDTAELYAVPPKPETYGLTEQYIGSWLQQHGNRDQLIIASKVAGPGEFVRHIRGGPQLNRQHMTEALNNSLKRLQTDYLDLYQIHWPSRPTNYFGQLGFECADLADGTPIEETLEVLNDFVQAGKVRHIGISNETPWGTMKYLELAERYGWPRIVSVQNPYSLLNRSYEVGLAEVSCRENAGLLAYSPLGFGVLSGKYLDNSAAPDARLNLYKNYDRYSNEQGVAATRAYVELARSQGLTPAVLALAFVNSRPFLTSNIIGATTMAQLRENIASIDIDLTEEVLAGIEEIHQQYSNPCP
ncbi:MAG: NADP(H)-dependent aldo-keto reductase [Thiotrichales bacterium]